MKALLASLLLVASAALPVVGQTPRATNLSTRMKLPAGETLTVGIVVADGPKTFLIRAVGPTLASFGVPEPMRDPMLTVLKGSQVILVNDDAAGAANHPIAFPLPPESRDAGSRLTLEPGSYTIQVKSADARVGGEVLAEVYELP